VASLRRDVPRGEVADRCSMLSVRKRPLKRRLSSLITCAEEECPSEHPTVMLPLLRSPPVVVGHYGGTAPVKS
jgi:hypothetical protein